LLPTQPLLERFLEWASLRPDIRAAALVGSAARMDHPADEWSDLDVVFVATDPQEYLSCPYEVRGPDLVRGPDWVQAVGNPWIVTVERAPSGEIVERRILFEGGQDVDFIVLPAGQVAARLRETPLGEIVARGMRILLDKDGELSCLSLPATRPSQEETGPGLPFPPPESAFLETVHDFWYHAVWTAKKLRRGELWVGKSCCDVYMKRLLLRMIAWHARATQSEALNTWYNGRYLEQWAAPRVVEGLGACFAHYDRDDVWRATIATMDLFRWIARETADRLALPYPADADGHATEWVVRCRPEM
jgi:aminoglycoside 6-adenylyltransferase